MASSSTQPLSLPRVQRPMAPSQPPAKPAGATVALPSSALAKPTGLTTPLASINRPPTTLTTTRVIQNVTLPPIRPITLPSASTGARPTLPPVTRPSVTPITPTSVNRPSVTPITQVTRPSTPTPAPTSAPAPVSTPALAPIPALAPAPAPAPAALPSSQPKQGRVSRPPSTPTPSPAPAPSPAPPPASVPAEIIETPAVPTPSQPKKSRRGKQPARQRRQVPEVASPPEPEELTVVPEGFPEITPPRPLPQLPPPEFDEPEGPYPRIILQPPGSPQIRSPSAPSPAPVQADGYWADGLGTPELHDVGNSYISLEGTEPPYLPADEQAILDEHEDEPWSQTGSIAWSENQLMIGDPEELFHFFRQFSSWEEFSRQVTPAPHQQIGQSILLFNSLDRAGFFNVYTTQDVMHDVDTEIHLVSPS
jgi:hypothetical protein